MAVKAQDLFMQWYPVGITTNGTNSTTLSEEEFTTGLSIRGDYAWLIHRVELSMPTMYLMTASNAMCLCLSVSQGETTRPTLRIAGTIVDMTITSHLLTSGHSLMPQPFIWPCLPPTVIASPKLSFYANTAVDVAALRSQWIYGRLGYTTIPIDQKLYLEIAETWETL